MKRKLNKKIIIFSSIILSLILLATGCKHNTNEDDSAAVRYIYTTLHISIGTPGLQASPAIDEDILQNIEFRVTAKDSKGNAPSTKNDEDFFTPLQDSEEDSFDYKIKLSPGEWTVTITGLINNQEILEGEKNITVKSNGSYSETIKIDFISKTIKNKNTGFIDLDIDVTAVPDIAKIKITGSGNSSLNSDEYEVQTIGEGVNAKRIITINPGSAIPYGTYTPILTFCTVDDIPVFSIPEFITVTVNMTTKYWFKTAKNPFLTAPDSQGHSEFVVTPALITEVLNTIFYVNGNTTYGKPGNTGSDYSNPLNTILNAFNRINVNNNNDHQQNIQRDYIIFVDDKAAASELIADNPLNLSIYTIGSSKLQISGTFIVGKNVNLTLDNFTISGNFTCDDNSTVSISNSDFSRSLTVGHDHNVDNIDPNIADTAAITLNNCTINNLAYCYTNTNSIDATNCTFKNSVTNYGYLSAESTGLDKNLACYGNSYTLVSATAAESKSIKGTVILNDSSEAYFTNISIGAEVTSTNSITLKNSSYGSFENVIINRNIEAQSTKDANNNVIAHSSITFAGTTRFTGTTTASNAFALSLKNGVTLGIKDVPAGDGILAAIKVEAPSHNLTVIEPAQEGQNLTSAQISRYELHNNGYYLAYDSSTSTGVVKLSSVKVKEPTIGGCTISIEGNLTVGDNGIYSLGRSDSAQAITITAEDPDGNPLNITSVKQYLGKTVISSETPTEEDEETGKVINFKRSVFETYGLEIRFIYNKIEYSEMLTVKII